MYPPSIARELRRRGREVSAVTERDDLRGLADAELFAAAQEERRCLVTENVRDYAPLTDDYDGRGEPHFGLVLVPARRYPRGDARTAGRLVAGLDGLLASARADAATSLRHWL